MLEIIFLTLVVINLIIELNIKNLDLDYEAGRELPYKDIKRNINLQKISFILSILEVVIFLFIVVA